MFMLTLFLLVKRALEILPLLEIQQGQEREMIQMERVMEVREVAFQRTTFLTHLIYLKLWVIHSASEYLFSV